MGSAESSRQKPARHLGRPPPCSLTRRDPLPQSLDGGNERKSERSESARAHTHMCAHLSVSLHGCALVWYGRRFRSSRAETETIGNAHICRPSSLDPRDIREVGRSRLCGGEAGLPGRGPDGPSSRGRRRALLPALLREPLRRGSAQRLLGVRRLLQDVGGAGGARDRRRGGNSALGIGHGTVTRI